MYQSDPDLLKLARRLVAIESSREPPGGMVGAARACEKLRRPLVKLVGADGFRSLLSRALAMAKAEAPALASIRVGALGSLESIDGGEPALGVEAGAVLLAHLIGLLAVFIGDRLTFPIVAEAWPDVPLDRPGREDEVAS
ncbi:hypothetical protein [Paludisphaera soli]|uniref:hypothetical protein n=1 Tax=Paludisphaera soli TaxID=2712865 RepID=UPI0013ED344A|nr:hypothetical protein [Paludisphaera soli]